MGHVHGRDGGEPGVGNEALQGPRTQHGADRRRLRWSRGIGDADGQAVQHAAGVPLRPSRVPKGQFAPIAGHPASWLVVQITSNDPVDAKGVQGAPNALISSHRCPAPAIAVCRDRGTCTVDNRTRRAETTAMALAHA